MSDRYDVIVIGVGTMGSAACYHLARRGVRVLGLEQFDIPHGRGAHHGFSRMIRSSYYEDPSYVPLIQRSYELWHELEACSGMKLLHMVGGLYMGPRDSNWVNRSIESAQRHGLPHEVLDRDEIARRHPVFHIPDDYFALFETQAGLLRPEWIVAAHCEHAMRAGAELHGHAPVTTVNENAAGVTVTTPRGRYQADRVIVAGGAWASRLVGDLGVELKASRRVLGWVWPKRPERFELGSFPAFAIDDLAGGVHYGFPMLPDNPGFKIAHDYRHYAAPAVNPDTANRELADGDEDDFRIALRRHIPDADGPLLAARVCFYTISPDGHPIVGVHPTRPRVIVAAGFSGHGFKFSSGIGETLADLATLGDTTVAIALFDPGRFR